MNETEGDRVDQITGRFTKYLHRAIRDVRGATSVEYALMASGIALAIVSTVFTLGDKLKENFYDKLAAMF